ncbi:hypothetical protein AMJ74_01760 [candidate division WOR_3 bacterium SM1_77]|uniref:Fibronectin type-III domain-containing protein n=1 Tax=candidate division WOR_3 bacterium SM1_77 TaxID=1703778 RepID=A0A0S8K0K8_UNCW3|nr:MAG: hypothetical protein AMJ74_01760 [candidate division WOR_3 bacterium SM1_77]
MKSLCALVSFVLVVMIGCNGALRVQAPEITAVIMDVTYVTVFWEKNNVIENNSDFAGYNVYVYTDSNALIVQDGEELNRFNSQLIQDTSYQINGLPQDSIYYIQIRTVNTDSKVGDYNSTTPFVQASPRPEFTVTMNMADVGQLVNDSCAIRYYDAIIMADSAMQDSTADMWVRLANNTVYLVSPDMHPTYGAGARNTLFTNVGPGEFPAVSGVTTEPNLNETACGALDIVVARTEDGNYVKIYIESIDMQNNAVTILYAYQNIADFPYF